MEIWSERPSINLRETLESGQAFHWKVLEQGTVIVSGHRIWYVVEGENGWEIHGDSTSELSNYLDLHRDYEEVHRKLSQDPKLAPYLWEGKGLHLLNQEPWDTVVGFIISANNNIRRIKNSIEALSKNYGDFLGSFEGENFHALPSPEVLSGVSPEELREKCGVGYRDKYLVQTARMVSRGEVNIEGLRQAPTDLLMEELLSLPGVGPKVAHCILLFGYGRERSFPVDTWMERVMNELYGPFENRRQIAEFGMAHFDQQAGYVQQLLFHGARRRG